VKLSLARFSCDKLKFAVVIETQAEDLLRSPTQLKFIRNTVAGRLKDTHGKNVDKQTNKTMKIKE